MVGIKAFPRSVAVAPPYVRVDAAGQSDACGPYDQLVVDEQEHDRWWATALDAAVQAEAAVARGAHHWACFFAEQCAQFVLKALLRGIGVGGWGRDLPDLGARLGEALGEALPDDVVAASNRLSRHYIAARYPDAHAAGSPASHYGPEDSRQAMNDVGLLQRFAGQRWAELQGRDAG